MITHNPGINTIPGTSQPELGCQCAACGTGKDQNQGGGNIPAGKKLRPVEEQSCQPADHSRENSSQDYPEGKAPEERISAMDISFRSFTHQGDAAKTVPEQCAESSAGFSLICKVTN